MRSSSFRTALAMAVLTALAVAVRPASAQVQYTVIPLGTLNGGNTYPGGINNSGQVVGWGGSGAFLYDGTMQSLGIGTNSEALRINSSGQIVGYYYTSGGVQHAFLYDGTIHDLGTPGGNYSYAYGINDGGKVVGSGSTSGDTPEHAFLYDGTMHDLGTLGGTNSEANSVNAIGQIVGQAAISGDTAAHAFLYDGTMHDLGTLGWANSLAWSINANGQVVGYVYTGSASHAFLYQNGTMQDLGTLGGSVSEAISINSSGQIVGVSQTSGGYHAFLYENGTMYDLNDLLTPNSGWTLSDPDAINDNGWITAYGHNPAVNNGVGQAVLLIPTPEPATIALLGLGVVGMLARRRNQR